MLNSSPRSSMNFPTVAMYPPPSMMANLDCAIWKMLSSTRWSRRSARLRMMWVVGDKDGCVAVALVAWVAGQGDDAVVRDADAAAQVEFAQAGGPI